MAIKRGEEWGWHATDSGPWTICGDDASIAAAIDAGAAVVRVTSGDIARTLGLADKPMSSESTWHVPLDALQVSLDGAAAITAAAHIRVGSWTSRLPWHVAMNAAFVGDQNLAPRAHPGDGFADVVTIDLGAGDRLKARRRSVTGSHVPHPGITIKRHRTTTLSFESPRRVHADGNAIGRATHVRIDVVPNAIIVAI